MLPTCIYVKGWSPPIVRVEGKIAKSHFSWFGKDLRGRKIAWNGFPLEVVSDEPVRGTDRMLRCVHVKDYDGPELATTEQLQPL